jgi:hypothetical protein
MAERMAVGEYAWFPEDTRHFGGDDGAHHLPDDRDRCLHCFSLLNDEGRCTCRSAPFIPPREPMPAPSGRNLTGAEAQVRLTEFGEIFGDAEDDE